VIRSLFLAAVMVHALNSVLTHLCHCECSQETRK